MPVPIFALYETIDGQTRAHEHPALKLTDAERAAGVTPKNFGFGVGDLERYGGDPLGSNDSSDAWQDALKVSQQTSGNVAALIRAGCTFKIVTGATASGPVTIRGEGPTSKLLCDGTVASIADGSYAVADNFSMENITAPYIVTRDPSDWSDTPSSATSNSILGYQPTVNDADIWSGLTSGQQSQQIGPTLSFTGDTVGICVSRIYGRFVRIDLIGASRSVVRDCDFRGGKGTWGAIVFDNSGGSAGSFNRALNNHVRYASFCGVAFLNNTDGLISGNIFELCGESGLKTVQGSGYACFNMTIANNKCNRNYYDGLDTASRFPLDDTQTTSHLVIGNESYGNGGTGINADGKRNSYIGNKIWNNYAYGFWGLCSESLIEGNYLNNNNLAANPSYHELLGGNLNNLIIGNRICMDNGGISYAIYAANAHVVVGNHATGGNFYFGSRPGTYAANIDVAGGQLTEQSFVLSFGNVSGTIQHAIFQQSGASATGNFHSRINGASATLTNTPTGADSSTAFAAGGKIGSAANNMFWMDTPDQVGANGSMIAVVIYNDTATSGLLVRPQLVSININGVTRTRLGFEFRTGAGAAFGLTTANIASGKTIQIQFRGLLA